MSGHRRRLTALTAAAAATVLTAGTVGASVPATAAVPFDLLCSGTVAPASNTATPSTPPLAVDDAANVIAGFGRTLDVLANDTDADGDDLYIAGLPTPREGTTCINGDNTVQYFAPMVRRNLTETFRYGVTDGDRYRTGTVSVAIEGVKPVRAEVRKRLMPGKGKPAARKARLAFTNPTSVRMYLGGGSENGPGPGFERMVPPGKTVVVRTKLRSVVFLAVLVTRDDFAPVNFGVVNTRSGRQQIEYFGDDEGFFFRQGAESPRELWGKRKS